MKLICSDCHEVMLDGGPVNVLTEHTRELGNVYICQTCNNRIITIDPTALVHENFTGLSTYKL